MDIGTALTFAFADPRRLKKLLIACLMALIPVLGWLALAGYGLRITREVAEGNDLGLPDWSDWGDLLAGGLRVAVVWFMWFLPALGLLCVMLAVSMPLTASNLYGDSNDGGSFVSWSLFGLVGVLFVPFALLVGFVSPAALGRVAVNRSIGAGLDAGLVLRMVRYNLPTYGLLFIVGSGISTLAAIGAYALFVGALFTTAYSGLINAHLAGQAYRRCFELGLVGDPRRGL